VLQAERFDKHGDYIRKWVPELASVKGKAIHAPYERLSRAEFEKLNYVKPMVDHNSARDRCLAAFKAVVGKK
jgi:deoxyribodipyrimidine photo-lyase